MTSLLRHKKNSLAVIAVSLGCLCLPLISLAQTGLSLSVSPTIFEMTANPSQQWESTLRVINTNPFPITVYATVMNFRPLGEGGASQFIPTDTSDGTRATLAEWVTVPNGELVIPPEETLQIPIVISPPADAPPGGHYAAVLVGTRPPQGAEGTMVETAQFVSSLIFLRVNGDIKESGSIRSFRTNQSVFETPTVEFELRFLNDGNVHLRPEGEIRIFNMWGQERGFIPINQKTLFGKVLSDSTRAFSFSWTGEWSVADIGRYRAEAVLAYGDSARQFTSGEVAFWIVPWRVLLVIIGIIALIIYGFMWVVKLYVRRMLTLAGMSESPLADELYARRRTHRSMSVIAPIEAGILDLRTRLTSSRRSGGITRALLEYTVQYRLFFASLAFILVSLLLVSWFFTNATTNERSFEVTVDTLDENLELNSEQLILERLRSGGILPDTWRDTPPVLVVNRSSTPGAAAVIAFQLEEMGYQIADVKADLDTVTERTVVVFDPQFDAVALDLSVVLDNALLSSYFPASNEPQLVVYVGKDISQTSSRVE